MLSGVTLRALAIDGTAVLRIVVSSDSMKKATAISHGSSALLAIGAAVATTLAPSGVLATGADAAGVSGAFDLGLLEAFVGVGLSGGTAELLTLPSPRRTKESRGSRLDSSRAALAY